MTINEVIENLNNEDSFIITSEKTRIHVNDFLARFEESELSLQSLLSNSNVTEENGWKQRFIEMNKRGELPD